MTEWVDVLVYGVFLTIIWIALPAVNRRFTVPIIRSRNPAWLEAHPDVAQRTGRARIFQRVSYALGVLSVALLVAAQTGVWPQALSAPAFEPEHWMVLSDLLTGLVIVWLLYFAAGAAIFSRWLNREVPLAERREASLERRSIDRFVPRALQIVVYTAVGLHLTAWVAVGLLGAYSSDAFWGSVAFQFGIALIVLLIARFVAERAPNVMDQTFGPVFRLTEARLAFVAQLAPLMNGFMQLQREIVGTVSPGIDRASRLTMIIIMIAGVAVGLFRFVWFSPSPPTNHSDSEALRHV